MIELDSKDSLDISICGAIPTIFYTTSYTGDFIVPAFLLPFVKKFVVAESCMILLGFAAGLVRLIIHERKLRYP